MRSPLPWLAVSAALAAAGCEPARPPDLEVLGADWSRLDGNKRAVSGLVRNNTPSPFDSVRVTIETSDAMGRSLGTVTAVVGSMEAYGLHRFDTPPVPERPGRFRVRSITGVSRPERVRSPRWREPPSSPATGRPGNR